MKQLCLFYRLLKMMKWPSFFYHLGIENVGSQKVYILAFPDNFQLRQLQRHFVFVGFAKSVTRLCDF